MPNLAGRAINPGDYMCSGTPLTEWLTKSIFEIYQQDYIAYIERLVFGDYILPLLEAAYIAVEWPAHLRLRWRLRQHHVPHRRTARGFWDIDTDRIELVAAKGTMLADAERLAAAYEFFYGYPSVVAAVIAEYVSGLVANSPVLERRSPPGSELQRRGNPVCERHRQDRDG
jgi:hypothetical protein